MKCNVGAGLIVLAVCLANASVVSADSAASNLRASVSEVQHAAPTWSFIAREVAQEASWFKNLLTFFFLICCVMPVCCGCIVFCTGIGGGYMVASQMNNKTAKAMNSRYEEKCIDPAQRKKYEAMDFKTECNHMFDMADTNQDGILDLAELKVPVEKYMKGGSHPGLPIEDLMNNFDNDDEEGIDKVEFLRMMKYLAWVRDGGDEERPKSYGSTGKKDKKDKKEKKERKSRVEGSDSEASEKKEKKDKKEKKERKSRKEASEDGSDSEKKSGKDESEKEDGSEKSREDEGKEEKAQ